MVPTDFVYHVFSVKNFQVFFKTFEVKYIFSKSLEVRNHAITGIRSSLSFLLF